MTDILRGQMDFTVRIVEENDLAELLALMRRYCDFYGVDPADHDLLLLSKQLMEDPSQGVQLIARDGTGAAIGFATVFWTWQTLTASRQGCMNDLYVEEPSRGQGVAEALIRGCVELCKETGATHLVWQTALDNVRAQTVYDRVGGERSRWLDYSLEA